MPRPDEMPMDPDVLAELEVIDLTLAGEPVDPEYAELAELALMLQMERQPPREEYARRLDARVSVRFRPQPISASHGAQSPPPPTKTTRLRAWFSGPAQRVGLAGLVAAAIAMVVIANTHLGGSSSNGSALFSGGSSSSAAQASSSVGAEASPRHATTTSTKNAPTSKKLNSFSSSDAGAAVNGAATLTTPGADRTASSGSYGAASTAQPVPTPSTHGRKVVQSAQLTLSSANNRINTVAQEVFDVVSQEHGVVKSSNVSSVSGKRGGNAFFDLSIPTGNLETTLQDLSALKYAHVVSRTNSTTDVTKTYNSKTHQLQDAQALRTSLLKQLAAASTQTQIDSLNQQLTNVEAKIKRLQNQLGRLQHRVGFSSLSVRLYSGTPPPIVKPSHSSGGFTISSALHDAGRVLVVAAGVMLIVAAAMVPIGLLALLVYWIVDRLRRHRREEALDQA